MPISLIYRMILSKKSAAFWDHALASQELVANALHFRRGVGNEHNARRNAKNNNDECIAGDPATKSHPDNGIDDPHAKAEHDGCSQGERGLGDIPRHKVDTGKPKDPENEAVIMLDPSSSSKARVSKISVTRPAGPTPQVRFGDGCRS